MKCSFVSDLHLDSTTPERNEAFRLFLRRESIACDELYVLGDLTETWIGDDDDSAFACLIRDELEGASTHCRVRLMHGNRDFLMGSRFAQSCGIELIDDPCLIECNGQRVLLCHGDTLCTDDLPYQRMRAVMRSQVWQDDVLAKSLDDRRALAVAMRQHSRATNANKPANIMDVAEDAVAHLLNSHAADVIVHGHTHRPGVHRITCGGRTGTRYVLGDWDLCGWLLRFDDDFTLLRFALPTHCEQ